MKKTLRLEFDRDVVKQPLLYEINNTFKDVEVNIRAASVTDEGGFMALEFEGEAAEVEKILVYLSSKQGIEIKEDADEGTAASGEGS